tara:strand:- start:74 stop:385 length:312 start_codon:yes stop_codon:yes gene_type:complete
LNLFISKQELVAKIISLGKEAADNRQVAKRLQTLLPERFKKIKEEYYHKKYSPGKSQRLALLDKRYLKFVTEYTNLAATAHKKKILWQTYTMLYQARQSTNNL